MKFTEKEEKLLEKMKKGELDGILAYDHHWASRGQVCKTVILDGIPCFISIVDPQCDCYPRVAVEQYYETDEMKLWFLKLHGWKLDDPEVRDYCNEL